MFLYSYKQSSLALSNLDHFIADATWVEKFRAGIEVSLKVYQSDHRVLLLMLVNCINGGPKPFRFQPHWFAEKELMSKIEGGEKSWSLGGM